MSLFRKPSTKKIGLKALVMGETGSGKSVFALSFPKVYALDAETGMSWYENDKKWGSNLLGVANTQSHGEMSEAIDEISEMVSFDEGSVGTLAIDSETKFYQNLTDSALTVEEKKAIAKGKDVMDSAVSMRGYGRIKAVATRLQNLKIDVSAKGVNVVSIAQIDDIKTKVGEQFVKIGEKPVMQKNSEYDYDLVVKLFTEVDSKGKTIYKGEIKKDRTGVTQVGQIIENPSYKIWQAYVESRDGADKIESKLAQDAGKSMKVLEKEDAEKEKSLSDIFKELMSKSEAHQKRGIELVREKGIKNPMKPEANEHDALEAIVKELQAI
ncbi:AAA family ATPase [Bacillus sp. FSL L8-0099]|uniref:AAA family ATPase n=1 Tax=unclassified Bacillus (in: firmicutes) TaxID=185979 RepID=UPI0030FB2229